MLPIIPGLVLAATLIVSPVTHGTASWYAYHPHQAAAGPTLRHFLGPHWRGAIVRVCTPTQCIRVKITDWMCRDRLIDLNKSDFARLAPTWRGLVTVTVQ
jgi:hypothetical protein